MSIGCGRTNLYHYTARLAFDYNAPGTYRACNSVTCVAISVCALHAAGTVYDAPVLLCARSGTV